MPYVAVEQSLRPYLGRLSLAQIGGVLEVVLADDTHDVVTPENLRVTADGRVEFVDVDLEGVSAATAAYMAPEHPLDSSVGPWSGLYSVGCLAFALLTGRPPFGDSGSPVAVLLRQVNEPVPRVGHVDARLADWVQRLLAKDPAARPQSAGEAWSALESILIVLLGPSWRHDSTLAPRRATGLLDAAPPATSSAAPPPIATPAAATPPVTKPRAATPPAAAARPVAATSPVAPANSQESVPTGNVPAVSRSATPAPVGPIAPPELTGRPAAASRRARTRPGWALPAAFTGGIAAVAIAAGALAADEPATPAPRTVLHTAGLTVELAAGWAVDTRRTPAVPGVEDTLTARGPRGATIVLGRADRTASNRSLLPDGLREGASGGRPARMRDGGQALRYDGLTVAGRPAFVYSVATTEGVTLLACFAQRNPCAAIAASIRGAAPQGDAGPDIARILGGLEARESQLVARLDGADTRAAQIWSIKRLWWAYVGAAKALRQLDVPPADRELRGQLAEALRLAGCAYGRAANRGGIARERAVVLKQQANAAAAIEGLGYDLPAGAESFVRLPDLL
jgi:hypothetical protein